jgi:hypothetical protein
MIKFLVRSFIVFLILVILLAGTVYFIDKEYLLKQILNALPTNAPISLGRISLLIDEVQNSTLYGFEIVDRTKFPIQKTIKAEYAQVDYDPDKKVVNITLYNGTIEEKNMQNITEINNQDFGQILITIDPQEIKNKLKHLPKQKDNIK